MKNDRANNADRPNDEFDHAKNLITDRTQSLIGQLNEKATEAALSEVDNVIQNAAETIKRTTQGQLAALLVEAGSAVLDSAERLTKIATDRAFLTKQLAALPGCTDFQFALSICYLLAAAAAFFTELMLTNSLTFLLGLNADDPRGRAMCVAFASSLLVFEIVFIRLKLLQNPWEFFNGQKVEPDSIAQGSNQLRGRLRVAAGMTLIFTLVGIAFLQGMTIVKMAPTREIASRLRLDRKAMMQPLEVSQLKESVLFFSICVLISGGFLAASGSQEIGIWFERKKIENKLRTLTSEERVQLDVLNKKEKPSLSAKLGAANLPFMWLMTAPLSEFSKELEKLEMNLDSTNTGVNSNAWHEGEIFGATCRLAVEKALTTPAVRSHASTLDLVSDIIIRGSGAKPDLGRAKWATAGK